MESMWELVESAKAGEQYALNRLYELTCRKALCVAIQLLKDEDQAQDIVQDSYIKAFQNLDTLSNPDKFQGWLDTIVINKCKDHLKKKKVILFSQMVSEEDSDKEWDIEDERDDFSPEANLDYKETRRLIQEMIDQLPEEQRLAIILRYMEEMPVKEIAVIMECSEGTIKSRLNYGRKSIRDKVLELEKKGTKLYCMPLAPFLYWMFRQQWISSENAVLGGMAAAVSKAVVTEGTTTAASTPAVASVTSSAVSSSTTTSVGVKAAAVTKGTVGKTIAVKIATIGAAVSLAVGGGVVAYQKLYADKQIETSVIHYDGEEKDIELLRQLADSLQKEEYKEVCTWQEEHLDELADRLISGLGSGRVMFNGIEFSSEINGEGLVLQIRENKDDSRNDIMMDGFYGNFEEGEPEGSVIGVFVGLHRNSESAVAPTFTRAEYQKGVVTGSVTTSVWIDYHEEGKSGYFSWIEIEGCVDEKRKPYGDFAISYPHTCGEHACYVEAASMQNGNYVIERGRVTYPEKLDFQVEIWNGSEEEFQALSQEQKKTLLFWDNPELNLEFIPATDPDYAMRAERILSAIRQRVLW